MTDITGLTNALTDVIIRVTDIELQKVGLTKGFFHEKSSFDYEQLLQILVGRKIKTVQGGSPANVIHGAARMGLKTALFGTVGGDDFGKKYVKALQKARVQCLFSWQEGASGMCYTLVTPDGEKTSFARLGVAGMYNPDLERLKETKLFHTSGYELLTNPAWVMDAIEYAKKLKRKVSFDLADPDAIVAQRWNLEDLLEGEQIDILFATEEEAEKLTGYHGVKALRQLSCPISVLKKGSKGSYVREGGKNYRIPVYKTEVINTNGAGDAYAAGFLFGYLKKFAVEECGRMGSYLASRVCGREKARF